MKWPSDRKFVDKDGKILDHWKGPLELLAPFLNYSAEDFTTLQALIRAAQNATEEDPFSLSAAIGALSVDEEPDPDTDYAVTYSGSTAYRTRLSSLGGMQLISDTPLTGTDVGLAIPDGLSSVQFVLVGCSLSGSGFPQVSFSEDSGANLLTAAYKLYNDALIQAVTSSTVVKLCDTIAAAIVLNGIGHIPSLGSVTNKVAQWNGVFNGGDCLTGTAVLTSTAPVNYMQISASGANTFDAGSIELWGMP